MGLRNFGGIVEGLLLEAREDGLAFFLFGILAQPEGERSHSPLRNLCYPVETWCVGVSVARGVLRGLEFNPRDIKPR